MRNLFLSLGLASLLVCVACGSGSAGFGGPPPTGNFSNASLSGQYAYQISGFDLGSSVSFREAGVFTADGNGNITAGTDDFALGSNIRTATVTGSYTIRNDGIGLVTLNFSTGEIAVLAISMVNSSKFYLIENDPSANAFGTGEKQDTTAFSAPPSGTFVFRLHTAGTLQGSSASVGAFTVTNGTVTGNEDVNRGGVQSSLTLNGLFNFPNASSGRGTGSFNDSSLVTTPFAYYIVNASTVLLMPSDPGVLGLGRAEKQSAGPFSAASLTGDYAFGSRGDTTAFLESVRTVGRFTADGNGNISTGAFDSVEEGTQTTNAAFTGTYTLAASGRAAVTITPTSGSPVSQVFWMVSPARAFFLIQDANRVEDGTLDLQQSGTFSNASINGQFAFVTDGFNTSFSFDRVGTLQGDGAGNLQVTYFLNRSGLVDTNPLSLSGTYSVAGNGRATASVDSLSNNLVFYLVSDSEGYILQNDVDTEIDGVMSKQQ
jgi:hypothetical protein